MLAIHHGRFCGLEATASPLALKAYLCQCCYRQAGTTSKPAPAHLEPFLTMSLCAPLVGVPWACFILTKIKLSAAFLTCETTKSACLSPYWGRVLELRVGLGHAGALVCFDHNFTRVLSCEQCEAFYLRTQAHPACPRHCCWALSLSTVLRTPSPKCCNT